MWGRGRQRAGCSCQLQEQLHTSHMQPHTSCTPATFQLYTSHMPVTHQPHIIYTPATHPPHASHLQLHTSFTSAQTGKEVTCSKPSLSAWPSRMEKVL